MVATLPVAENAVNPRVRVARSLTAFINAAYDPGVDLLLLYNLSPDKLITGRFKGGRTIYDFEITPQGVLSYEQAGVGRSDAYLIGLSVESGLILRGVWRDDDGPRDCKNSTPCRNGCIHKEFRCTYILPQAKRQQLPQLQQDIALVRGVRQTPRPATSPKIGGSLAGTAATTATAIAGVLGISTAAYFAARSRYRAGFEESAQMATEKAKDIAAEPIKARQHTMIFTVGGMAYADESPDTISGQRLATTMKMALSRSKGKDFKLIPVSNADTNIPVGRRRGSTYEQAVDAIGTYTRKVAQEGRSKTAVELSAHVIAWADANPNAQIVMAGHSMGGYDVHEAQEILRRARPDLEPRLKSFAIGSHHLGFTEKFGESHTIGSPNDTETSLFPTRDLRNFPDVKGHSQGAYFASLAVKQFMADVIYRDVPKSANPSSQQSTKKDAAVLSSYQRSFLKAIGGLAS